MRGTPVSALPGDSLIPIWVAATPECA